MIWQNFQQKTDLKILLGALKRWTFLTIKVFIPCLRLLSISALAILFLPKQLETSL